MCKQSGYNRAMRYPESLLPGTFIARLNRFAAMVDMDGKAVIAHVANSGRLAELFQPGAPVLLAVKDGPHRKTAFDLVLVQTGDTLVSADSRLPPHLVRETFMQQRLPEFKEFAACRGEVLYEDSRLDLLLEGEGGRCFIEVKSCTLVRDGLSLFPDAPTTRGRRHLLALAHAKRQGMRAAVVFVVQRGDAAPFRPHDVADPAFGETLRQVSAEGVEVLAYRCEVSPAEITLGARIPLAF